MLQSFYAVDAATDLYPFVPPDGTLFLTNGKAARGDRAPLMMAYSSTSMASDDGGLTTIRPSSISAASPGRYLIDPFDYTALLTLPSLSAVAISGNYSDLNDLPALKTVATSGQYSDLTGKPSLAAVATSGQYADLTGLPTIPSNTGQISESGNLYYTDARARNAMSNGTGISYNATTGVITNSAPAVTPSFSSAPGRLISTTGSNNTFTVSATRNAMVTYTINFSAALTLTTSSGKITLDYSTNGGSTWTTISSVSQAFGISITITTNQDMVLYGIIPANALVRINRSANTNVTITAGSQQEVLI